MLSSSFELNGIFSNFFQLFKGIFPSHSTGYGFQVNDLKAHVRVQAFQCCR